MGIPLTKRSITADVWTRTGLNSTELGEDVIHSAIDAAMTEFSNVRPKDVYGTMNVLAGVDIYDMPAGVDELNNLYYGTETTILNNFSFEDILLSSMQGTLANINFGGDIFENPVLTRIWFSKMRQFQDNMATPTWTVLQGANTDDGADKIRLFRVPDEDGTAYYEGTGFWVLEEIVKEDVEIFKKAVLWKTCESRAMKLAVAADYYEYGGIRLVPATPFWQKKSEQYREEFFADVGFGRGTLVIG